MDAKLSSISKLEGFVDADVDVNEDTEILAVKVFFQSNGSFVLTIVMSQLDPVAKYFRSNARTHKELPAPISVRWNSKK